MPAPLSGDQFFHGTTHNVKDGVVQPAVAVGKSVSEYSMGDPGDMSEGGDHAFAVRNDENYAWHAAMHFHRNGRRPRVYEVEPAADMKPGPWNKEHPDFEYHHEYEPGTMPEEEKTSQHQDEWASPTGFKVKNRIDIAPGHQGTFPEVNWNRFKKDASAERTGSREQMYEASLGPDVNHPSDEQVRYGMKGHPQESMGDVRAERPAHLSQEQFHDWKQDPAPHSPLREAAGRPQKRWATLLD